MISKTVWVVGLVIVGTLAAAGFAAAQAPVEDPCRAAYAGTGDKYTYASCWQATNGHAPTYCPSAVQREKATEERASGGTGGCSEAACRHVTLYNVDPARGDDCHEVLCRNVPAVIDTVKVPFLVLVTDPAGLGGLLEQTEPTKLVKYRTVRIVKSAAFWCETGSGTGGGSPSPCKQVVDTPLADAGADPFVWSDLDAAKATECSWATTTVGGYTYVGDGDATGVVSSTGGCGERFNLYAAFGSERERYNVAFDC